MKCSGWGATLRPWPLSGSSALDSTFYYLAYQKGQSSLEDSNWDKTDCEENSIFPPLLLTPLSSLFLLSFINLFTCDSMSCFKQQQGEVKKSIYNSTNYSQGSEQQLSHWSDGLLTSFCRYGVLACTTRSFTTLAMLAHPPPQHENSYCETQALKPPPLHLAENVGWATLHGNHLNRMQLSYVSLSPTGKNSLCIHSPSHTCMVL